MIKEISVQMAIWYASRHCMVNATIESVDFGRLDAENDGKLQDYFVDTGVLGELQSGRKYLVLGRKGAGKTALFKAATAERFESPTIPLDFEDYPWEVHGLLRDTGLTSESLYTASWKFLFLINIVLAWSKEEAPFGKESLAAIEAIYGKAPESGIRVLIDKAKRLRQFNGPELEGVFATVGFELDEVTGPIVTRGLHHWVDVLESLVKKWYSTNPITVLIDRLDDGWDATENSKNILVGAVKASRSINLSVGATNIPQPVILFLRTDIFDNLQFNDKNKLGVDVQFLDWDDASLTNIANERIARSLKCGIDDAWYQVFSRDEMRQRAKTLSYVLKRTMNRPRDMIAFCIFCQDVARMHSHSLVTTEDIYEAEDRYSRHIFDELIDEMHKQLPNASALIVKLKSIGAMKFDFAQWKQSTNAKSDESALADLTTLFSYGVLGTQSIGGHGGGSRHRFIFDDRHLAPNFSAEIVVHASLKKQLQLRETQSG